MADREKIETELTRLNALVDEAEARLGAHSIKPELMQRLFELEEERDALIERLKALSEKKAPESS